MKKEQLVEPVKAVVWLVDGPPKGAVWLLNGQLYGPLSKLETHSRKSQSNGIRCASQALTISSGQQETCTSPT